MQTKCFHFVGFPCGRKWAFGWVWQLGSWVLGKEGPLREFLLLASWVSFFFCGEVSFCSGNELENLQSPLNFQGFLLCTWANYPCLCNLKPLPTVAGTSTSGGGMLKLSSRLYRSLSSARDWLIFRAVNLSQNQKSLLKAMPSFSSPAVKWFTGSMNARQGQGVS